MGNFKNKISKNKFKTNMSEKTEHFNFEADIQ